MSTLAEPEVIVSVEGWRNCRGRQCRREPPYWFYSEEPSVLCPECRTQEDREIAAWASDMVQAGRDAQLLAEERAAHEATCPRCINGNGGTFFERRARCASYPA